MSDIDLGSLAHGPHADLIRDMTSKCSADSSIQAIWIGGSLAAGLGDPYSNSRVTLHMLGALHRGLDGRLTEHQHNILGLPSRTPAETITVIEAIRAEMAGAGRWLADRHAFAYPHELEDVVQRVWNKHKEALTRR